MDGWHEVGTFVLFVASSFPALIFIWGRFVGDLFLLTHLLKSKGTKNRFGLKINFQQGVIFSCHTLFCFLKILQVHLYVQGVPINMFISRDTQKF